MPEQIFAYILHKNGSVDDTAAELIHAANAISPEASVVAVVAGSGDELQAVCDEVAKTYAEVWKIDSDALVYINAEVLRGLLVRVLPKNPVVLVPHEHFGMDLSPGLSVKLDAAYLPDVVAFEGLEGELLLLLAGVGPFFVQTGPDVVQRVLQRGPVGLQDLDLGVGSKLVLE